ncbi:MAG: folylpolyglutamate synthase/dihydrofolate synthase family protein [Peptoniphilus harei]|uniref:tetrahydrofolate synthase n=1 Tax=Peptoniphilus harei ACS-146-V-Sch2b TaxID=908338 RepID=E4KXD4_9FIRM|nr:folylpolyglutamate synthase/dihydrofolate synthase family protein [Peptoniphilus harei]EFR33418.1 bifunctional protein FolC [Peptoniphilus harei ACS-146-V-Sch2b]MDK7755468.1 folylpolyglutamate synthase/dihydrofolate synthase family protein [Peptoniphilus harei]MDK7761181.1 folylpolyglutamate synthase/dihydrofolate synthase family protein [Peptoniphilus harei]MDK8270971.1 folylpolyglutamate synthase/dihydrofolate synthase family protein [Peptoniphilus harei]MDK8339549.1 folylpolyglutamate sy
MDYKEAVAWLENRNIPLGEFTLDNIKALLEIFNKPQDKLKIIHITGTNGKGSVASFITGALIENNYSVGKFTSPYITNIREEIEVNREVISEEDFAKLASEVRKEVEELDKKEIFVSGFEILTSIAYIYFARENLDFAVMEVGMGGRVDATNVMKKSIPVFCHIALDHANILGDSLEKIAREKGGIIKENSHVFSYPQAEEAKEELKKISKEKSSSFSDFEFDEVEIISSNEYGNKFNFRTYKDVEISLIGDHQAYNAALALMVLEYLRKDYKLGPDKIKEGLKRAENIGRTECLSRDPLIVVDGSHNLDSIEGIEKSVKKFTYNKLILGFSLLKDKDHKHILEKIERLADKIVLTEIDSDRFTDIDLLEKEFKKISNKEIFAIKDRKEAVEKTLELAGEGDMILWCGSLYLIKDIRKIILEKLN